jgi:hypothetical protein
MTPLPASAQRPVIEKDASVKPAASASQLYEQADEVPDPTVASIAVYGRIATTSEVDLYTFTASGSATIPIEALVPVTNNSDLRPAVIVLGQTISPTQQEQLPLPVPDGYQARVIAPPQGERSVFTDRLSLESFYRGAQEWVAVEAGQRYYIAVYEPAHNTGGYSLRMGAVQSFRGVSYLSVIGDILAVKLGLTGGRRVPWGRLLGLFLHLVGFTLGLGASVVAGAVAVTSGLDAMGGAMMAKVGGAARWFYWFGLILGIIGALMLYRATWLSGVAALQAIIALAMIANGVYFSRRVGVRSERSYSVSESYVSQTRRLRRKIGVSIAVSLVGWLAALFLTSWHALILMG